MSVRRINKLQLGYGEKALIHGKTIFYRPYLFMNCIAQERLMTIDLVGHNNINNQETNVESQTIIWLMLLYT